MGKAKVNLNEFMDWCDENKAVSRDEDESFVLASEFKENNKIKYFRVIITTLRLMSLALFSKSLLQLLNILTFFNILNYLIL